MNIRAASLWLAAAGAAAFTIAVFYPGYLSFDSADQWRQARAFAFNDLHPPLPALLWHALDRLWPGPGGMFVLQVLLYWGGLALLATSMLGALWRRVTVLATGFWPPLFGLLPHLWKDVWMAGLLALAAGLLLADARTPRGGLRVTAWITLLLAATMRHNAWPALLPFSVFLVGREAQLRAWRGTRVRRWLAGIAMSVLLVLVAQLPSRLAMVTRTDSPWSVLALWDLAAVSIAEDHLLIPPGLRRANVDLDLLRARFLTYSNTSLFIDDALRHSLFVPYDDIQRRALLGAWLRLPFAHPRAYLAHRLRLAALLLGWAPQRLPDRMVLMPGIVELPGNPSLTPAQGRLNASVQAGLDALIDTPLFAGGLYLLLAVLAALFAWPRRRRPETHIALLLVASAWLYSAPLVLIAGSAEFRYLDWPIQAALLAAALVFTSRLQCTDAHRRKLQPG